jgi:hypothetical protein
MSSILYLFYNANLLKLLEQSFRKITIIDFVNDINILIYDINTINNFRLLKEIHEHCLLWSRRHEVIFASIKYELIHFVKNTAKFDMQTSIKICDVVKQSMSQIRMLRDRQQAEMKDASAKHTRKNDDTVVNFFTIDCVHLRSVLRKNQTDLHDDHSINYHLRFDHLIRVARTFE